MKSFLIFATLLSSQSVFAENFMSLLGGGGEPTENNGTMFDSTLSNFENFTKENPNKWKYNISFDGGHKDTEALVNSKFSDATIKSTFTKNNFNILIKNYENQINSGKIKSGDKLMIMIDSHGAAKSDDSLTHAIAVGPASAKTDKTSLSGSETTSLDPLANLAKLAKDKGIKLAVLDFSCHSGNSQSLANDNTCVISSTGPKHFGYDAFSKSFIPKMKAGKSLEEIFLETRKSTSDNSYPMISSPEGQSINNEYYPTLTPYLFYYDASHDKLTNYLIDAASIGGQCRRELLYEKLIAQVQSLKAAAALNNANYFPEVEKLKSLIDAYKKKQDDGINKLKSWGIQQLSSKNKESFKGSGTYGKKSTTFPGNYTIKEILETNVDEAIANITDYRNKLIAKKDTDENIAMFTASLDMHSKVKARQVELLKQYPELKNYKEKFTSYVAGLKTNFADAEIIANQERKVYDSIYSSLKPDNKNKPNPCKDFVL